MGPILGAMRDAYYKSLLLIDSCMVVYRGALLFIDCMKRLLYSMKNK